MNDHFKHIILESTGADELFEIEQIQELWSGYGHITRYGLRGAKLETIVVKHVRLPKGGAHPRGWNSNLSHARKLKSYAVETAWYAQWSNRCDDACRVPHCFGYESHADEVLIVLEDLNASGFGGRRSSVSTDEILVCLNWLANFHATFLGEVPKNLWPVGTYWHLQTRPDELKILKDKRLKQAAVAIDQKLNASPYQTFVHGDAKLANFCFSSDRKHVAAVDFQYVGGGCGMKDVAYFIGSCLRENECEQLAPKLLNDYFEILSNEVRVRQKNIDVKALELNWRTLYPVAWTDFHRFIKGWSPGHWKINSYSERLAREVLETL